MISEQDMEGIQAVIKKTDNYPQDAPSWAKYMVIQGGMFSYFKTLDAAYETYSEFWSNGNAELFELIR